MNIKNLFQKILDGYEDTVPSDDFDDEPIYTPKNGAEDEVVEMNRNGVRPVRRPVRPAAPVVEDDDDEEVDELVIDPEEQAEEAKPRFKKVKPVRVKSGEQIVSLAKEGYVVVVDTSSLAASVQPMLRYYLAGAMYALGAHITPVDDNVFIFSIEAFDVKAFVESHS